ncbi:MAG: haloacid dehalogenase type II [Candidatus Dadabacteria bacterium]|nr:haloacid dehalogenase type II [Candidatus Dadabacteria bacterium]
MADISTRIKALTFDVFGTVVDWRSSIIGECEALGERKGITRDWARFADEWRGGYAPAMNMVRTGELPWTSIDDLHRMVLDRLLSEFDIAGLTEEEKDDLNRAWHRLSPWPDSLRGIERLRTRYVVATLSNGNVSLLVDMAKNAGLVWDCVLSSELAGRYKPDREVYLTAASLLGLEPGEVMMAAAHRDDLEAARSFGLGTAFISRPLEFGPEGKPDTASGGEFDVVAKDIIDLAEKLGA